MSDTKEIGAGKGFFSATGELKSKEQLSEAKAKSKDSGEKTQSEPASTAEDFSSKVSNSLGAVRSKFVGSANEIASVVNTDEKNIKAAQDVVKDQLAAARELKSALKDDDVEAIKKSTEKLDTLSKKREEIAAQIKVDNERAITKRVKNLSYGNEQRTIVKTEEVKFESSSKDSPDSVKDVNQLIDQLQADKESLNDQRKVVKEAKGEIKEAVAKVRDDIKTLKKDTIDSYDKASKLADKLNQDIKAGAEAFVAHNIQDNVANLLLD